MSAPKPEKGAELSGLGKKIESTLAALLKEMEQDSKKAAADTAYVRKFTLTDLMKVSDRALKLEAIKAKIQDPEGSFFTEPPNGGRGTDEHE